MKILTTLVLAAALTGGIACSSAPTSESSAPAPTPASQKVHYEDAHIRFVEYTLYSGPNAVEAVPYPSVLMTDAAWPEVSDSTPPGDAGASSETQSETVLPFDNRPYPYCRVESPRAARVVTVSGDFPQHYYRVEYKRVDGKDYPANWQTWYPDVFAPPAKVVKEILA